MEKLARKSLPVRWLSTIHQMMRTAATGIFGDLSSNDLNSEFYIFSACYSILCRPYLCLNGGSYAYALASLTYGQCRRAIVLLFLPVRDACLAVLTMVYYREINLLVYMKV